MSESKKQQKQKLDISIDEQTADGVYSNLAVINHSRTEFVVDFLSVMPGSSKARVKSRIILTPEHAKRLQMALTQNIRKYQSAFGEIKSKEPIDIPLNLGLKGEA
ncbi:MAG: DUF3467 domain-containing protein [Flavobacteriaceae bacterium]|nr:DUF3467 domain-containing protein [Flavobacteriaceae bacterium]MCY4267588.1 DUF3467 domain-containing protein [Flavobacteriaceae bacterium]MCY4298238.1 DUF3467 domain-containing protein [Flavobacteriaceae bacterium]